MNLEPSNQSELFVHKNQFNELVRLYLKKSLPNKILLSGSKGVGKSTLAYHLINFILSIDEEYLYDLKNLSINPKNKSFKLIQNKTNPNFILVDVFEEKKNIDINQIRNLILSLNKSSFNSKPRFVLIDNIELLNVNSVNALLKILEEPNDNIYFILINNNKKMLPTLKSRCLDFKISLTQDQSISIVNNLLKIDLEDVLNKEFITHYSSPGEIFNIINFAKKNDINLKNLKLKNFIKLVITKNRYKKDISYRLLIYSLIELYLRNNISVKDIKLINFRNYFLKKMNNTKIFNLDEDSLFTEFEYRFING